MAPHQIVHLERDGLERRPRQVGTGRPARDARR